MKAIIYTFYTINCKLVQLLMIISTQKKIIYKNLCINRNEIAIQLKMNLKTNSKS